MFQGQWIEAHRRNLIQRSEPEAMQSDEARQQAVLG